MAKKINKNNKKTKEKKNKPLVKFGLFIIFLAMAGFILMISIEDSENTDCINTIASKTCNQYELTLDKVISNDNYVNCLAPMNQVITIKLDDNALESCEFNLFE